MLDHGYDIDISRDVVSVLIDDSTRESKALRWFGSLFLIGIACAIMFGLMFSRDKYGTSVWDDLDYYRWPSGHFVTALILAVFIEGLGLTLLLWALRLFFPTGESLHCTKSSLTVARIPWSSLRGKWISQVFPIADIRQFRFAITRSGKNKSYYGFRFDANGQQHKIFAGLTPIQCQRILKGLKTLGLAVGGEAMLRDFVKEEIKDRRASLDYPRPTDRD